MPQPSSSTKNTLETINHVIRGLSLVGILWVVNTTNITSTNLSVLTNDVSHIQKNQERLKSELLEKMSDRFTGTEGKRLERDIIQLEQKFEKHKDQKSH